MTCTILLLCLEMHIFNNRHLEGLYAPTGDAVAMNTDECNYSDSEFTNEHTRLFLQRERKEKKNPTGDKKEG